MSGNTTECREQPHGSGTLPEEQTGRETSRARRALAFSVRCLLAASLLFCGYKAARQGVAAWYFRQGTPEAVESAIRWDPGNPQYFNTWGSLLRLYSNTANVKEVLSAYEEATRLSPQSAIYWADLGEAYEWAGQRDAAAPAFERAARLAPNSAEIHWRKANFEIRAGDISAGLVTLRGAFSAEGVSSRQIFSLAYGATRDIRQIMDLALPQTADVLFDFLGFLLAQRNLEGADNVWERVQDLDLSFELRQAFPYLDAQITGHEPQRAFANWASLAAKFPSQIPFPARGRERINNGRFAAQILNGGLDWRVLPAQGARVTQESSSPTGNSSSLRIDFDGTENVNYAHVMQYLVVEPGTRYRFSAEAKAEGITTDSAPRFQITDAYDARNLSVSTMSLSGNSDGPVAPLEFRTGPQTRLLLIRVVRPSSDKFANRIAGSLTISAVTLEEIQ